MNLSMTRLSLLFVVLVGAGCGSARIELGEVSGEVFFRDQPIESGTIVFEVEGSRPASGRIEKGKIVEVTTYEPGDGAPLGTANVAIFAKTNSAEPLVAMITEDPGESSTSGANYMGVGGRSLIPTRYNDPTTSLLSCDIQSGRNTLRFDLKK